MTGITLHVQWSPTSVSHGTFLKENNWFFVADQTPRPLELDLQYLVNKAVANCATKRPDRITATYYVHPIQLKYLQVITNRLDNV
jgi:hypothetical protein